MYDEEDGVARFQVLVEIHNQLLEKVKNRTRANHGGAWFVGRAIEHEDAFESITELRENGQAITDFMFHECDGDISIAEAVVDILLTRSRIDRSGFQAPGCCVFLYRCL